MHIDFQRKTRSKYETNERQLFEGWRKICHFTRRRSAATLDKALINKLIYLLKYPFKLWAYECIDQWILATIPRKPQKKVLVFRLDLLGDYLMSRPFFASLKAGSPWAKYQWTFAGNQLVQSISENIDNQTFSTFIWIDRARFINSIGYRYSILKKIRLAGFEVAIYPSHTRQFWLESIIRVCGAKQRITAQPVGKYMSHWEQNLCNQRYTQIISTGRPTGIFEFYRNQSFFGKLSPESQKIKHLIIEQKIPENHAITLEKPYLIIAPGASTANREWPIAFFADVARKIASKNNWQIVVIGSAREKSVGEKLKKALPEIAVENLAGKTNLIDLLHIIKNAKLLIGNESGPIHMAASLQCSAICISQGNHFSRWNPYPESIADWISTVYPLEFGDWETNRKHLIEKFHDFSDFPIETIRVEQVLSAVEKQMASIDVRDQGHVH